MGSKNQKKRNEISYITELSQERQIQLSKHGQVSLPYKDAHFCNLSACDIAMNIITTENDEEIMERESCLN